MDRTSGVSKLYEKVKEKKETRFILPLMHLHLYLNWSKFNVIPVSSVKNHRKALQVKNVPIIKWFLKFSIFHFVRVKRILNFEKPSKIMNKLTFLGCWWCLNQEYETNKSHKKSFYCPCPRQCYTQLSNNFVVNPSIHFPYKLYTFVTFYY